MRKELLLMLRSLTPGKRSRLARLGPGRIAFAFAVVLVMPGAAGRAFAEAPENEDDHEHEGTSFSAPHLGAAPGEVVHVPIRMDSSVGIVLATFSLRYPAGSLGLTSPVLSPVAQDILERNVADSSLLWRVDDAAGRFQASLVTDYLGRAEYALPAGSLDLAVIDFVVEESAPAGVYPIRFTREDDEDAESEFEDSNRNPIFNHARREGGEFEEEEEFEEGEDVKLNDGSITVSIIGDVTIFARGDANADRRIDISDPVMVLGYLFLGRTSVSCDDACDANDDGIINLSDSVEILQFLFHPKPGSAALSTTLTADLTPDDLDCAAY